MTIYLDFLYSSDLFKNMEAMRGGGEFFLCIYRKNFKKSLCQKCVVQIGYTTWIISFHRFIMGKNFMGRSVQNIDFFTQNVAEKG